MTKYCKTPFNYKYFTIVIPGYLLGFIFKIFKILTLSLKIKKFITIVMCQKLLLYTYRIETSHQNL